MQSGGIVMHEPSIGCAGSVGLAMASVLKVSRARADRYLGMVWCS